MSKIFCITSTESVGGTFLDWSIHYLAGETQFYNIESGWIDLTLSPLTHSSSHNHKKNHPQGLIGITSAMQLLKQVDSNNTLSVYAYSAAFTELTYRGLGISRNIDDIEILIDNHKKDYAAMWSYCTINQIPLIFINLNSDDTLFLQTDRSNEFQNPDTLEIGHRAKKESQNIFLDTFFRDSQTKWQGLGTNSIWDRREYIALNIRPYRVHATDKWVNFSTSHYYLDAKELWYNGKDTLINIMQYLNLTVDADRLLTWLPIYYQWQQKQLDILKFVWNVEHICDCIVNNKYYDISGYALDLWHEAIIQHIMIYKYGSNFKAWNLEKFPNNTQDLYKLLEPNIHPVEDIYGIGL